jgi:hypothetical protein
VAGGGLGWGQGGCVTKQEPKRTNALAKMTMYSRNYIDYIIQSRELPAT